MGQFFTDLPAYSFLQYALWTALLVSIPCGIMGSYIVTRRITYLAGGIAHTIFGGLGAARYLERVYQVTWLTPMHGAIVAALLAAVIIGAASTWAKEREDTVISAIWSVGMAVGILFIAATPGPGEDLMSYLFGSILMVSAADLTLMGLLDILILGCCVLFYHQFFALSFDEEFTRLRAVPVGFYHFLILTLTALTVVLLITVVGIVMAIALLTLPAAIAGFFTRRLWQMMITATILTVFFTTGGIIVSYRPDLPAGGVTILLTGAVYLAILIWQTMRKHAPGTS